MRTILIADTETSGLDPAADQLLEVGLVRWSVEHRCVFACASWLVQATANPAHAVNGIPPAAVLHSPTSRESSDIRVRVWADGADAIVAHNAAFDRQWLPDLGKPWICTLEDFEWPRPSPSRSLTSIALAHGVGVTQAHRALTDCLLLAQCLERVAELGHDVGALLDRAMLPRITIRSHQPFAENEAAKAHGFRFDPATKQWRKRILADAPREYPFPVTEVSP